MADFPSITRLMEKQGLDALLTLGMRNCAYLAGDVTEEPWLNEPQGLGAWMTCIAPPDKSFAIGGSRMADFDMPLDRLRPDQTRDARLQVTAEEIQARKLGQARVGLDMDYAAISDLAKLQEFLPAVQFESADMLLARARSMKTPRELDWIKKAVAASEAGYKEMQKEIRAGIPFRDLNTIWAATVLKHDALPVYAAPISWMVPRRGQYKQPDSVLVRGPEEVEEGLVYRVDYSAVAGGYFSDQKFNFCLGTPLKESYAVWQEHRDRQIFMENFIRPGMSKREVFAACRAEFKNVEEYMWWIHGVGMEVHEEPQLGSLLPHSLEVKPEITFEENNVSALESSWLVEDIYVLKADGFQRLGTIPQEVALF